MTLSSVVNASATTAGPHPTAPVRQIRRRVCIISDDLSGQLDEGAKNATIAIAASLRHRHDVELISTQPVVGRDDVRSIPTSLTFVGRSLGRELRRLDPDVVLYATRRSATFFSIARARVLRSYCPSATIAVFGWQTRHHPGWQRLAIRRLRPDAVIVQSTENGHYLSSLGCRVVMMPSGVDTARFHPVTPSRRRQLRQVYGLDPDRPVVVHVGHLVEGRGIRVLGELAQVGSCQVVLVASTSSDQQAALRDELEAAGVVVMTHFLPAIEELYQLADCYLFPVTSTNNAIEAPLSVLEALACDLPVVSTRFAGLPTMFGPDSRPGLTFVDAPSQLVEHATLQAYGQRPPVRYLVEPFAWDSVANDLLDRLLAIPEDDAVSE